MNDNKIKQFMNKLSKDTLSGKVHWNHMTDYENISYESNKIISDLIFQCEFRHLELTSSYYTVVSNGEIYLLNEPQESGRDGTIISGYNMYLHREGKNNISRLHCSSGSIYQLLNSIHVYLSDAEEDLETFIDEFLSQTPPCNNQ